MLEARDIRLATEAECANLFPDCQVGTMPPFGNLYVVEVYVDQLLTEDESIVFEAGTYVGATTLRYKDFAGLVRPKVAAFHHEPSKIELELSWVSSEDLGRVTFLVRRMPLERAARRIFRRGAIGKASGHGRRPSSLGMCFTNRAVRCASHRDHEGACPLAPGDQYRRRETFVSYDAPPDQFRHGARRRRGGKSGRYQPARAVQLPLSIPAAQSLHIDPTDLGIHLAHPEHMRNRDNLFLGVQQHANLPDRRGETEQFLLAEALSELELPVSVDSRPRDFLVERIDGRPL